MKIEDSFKILLDNSCVDNEETTILSDFMIGAGGIIEALSELLRYSDSKESSDLISDRYSLSDHFRLSSQLREKLNKVGRGEKVWPEI